MSNRTNDALMPWTKVVLAVSAIVQFVLALIALFEALFASRLIHNLLWPPPFEPWPRPVLLYNAALYIAMSVVAAYALLRSSWSAARTYLAIAGLYVALCVFVSILVAVTPPGAPAILWFYVASALLYLSQLVWVFFRQESARTSS